MKSGPAIVTTTTPSPAHGGPAEVDFDAGDEISASAAGDVFASFDASASGPPQAIVESFPAQQRLEIFVGHDCPPSTFLRCRRGAQTTADGLVELIVGSKTYFYPVHEVD